MRASCGYWTLLDMDIAPIVNPLIFDRPNTKLNAEQLPLLGGFFDLRRGWGPSPRRRNKSCTDSAEWLLVERGYSLPAGLHRVGEANSLMR
jgi:hypothetical protein